MLLALLPESLEVGSHTDTVDLEFEGQPCTLKNFVLLPMPKETQLFPHGPVATQELAL